MNDLMIITCHLKKVAQIVANMKASAFVLRLAKMELTAKYLQSNAEELEMIVLDIIGRYKRTLENSSVGKKEA